MAPTVLHTYPTIMEHKSETTTTACDSKRKNKKRKLNHDVLNDVNSLSSTRKCKATSSTSDGATNSTAISSSFVTSQLDHIFSPDFAHLASIHADFATQWNKVKQRQRYQEKQPQQKYQYSKDSFSTHVDFDFNLALTRAILSEYFNLSLPSMPRGYLCPPIPNRLNYVLWIKELLYQMYDCDNEYFDKNQNGGELSFSARAYKGIDIGTGASCIYPLLLCSKYFDESESDTKTESMIAHNNKLDHTWQFLGTDIDPLSIQHAQQNVEANQLQDKINVVLVPPTHEQSSILKSTTDDSSIESATPIDAAMKEASKLFHNESSYSSDNTSLRFDFVMTNPPFYSTIDDATKPRMGDGRNRIEMTNFESVYPGQPIGGEVKFVLDMIHDSLKYKNKVSWFTSMLGKKSSYIPIINELETLGLSIGSIRKTEFVQGNTIRWGIAWTFQYPSLRSKG